MKYPLCIAYITNRKNPRLHWFLESLARQLEEPQNRDLMPQLVVVSFHNDIQMDKPPKRIQSFRCLQPKPNPYMGPHRITKSDCFAAAVSRNTALCAADAQYIAYVDDLSVLMPGWLNQVRLSMAQGRITFGAYKKVKNLVVKDGLAVGYEEFSNGVDNRLASAPDGQPRQCEGKWLYGCSLVLPVEQLLVVGGWPENLTGALGFEDCLLGIALQNAGFSFWYDPLMLTLESEEAHFEEKPFFKCDKGTSPNDKSHAVLHMVLNGTKYFDNCVEGGIRKVRENFLAGKPFPVVQNPQHDWYDGQSLREVG
jgi:hypothetical protein